MRPLIHFLVLTSLILATSAKGLDLTLYINKDSVEVQSNWASACSFNRTDTFDMKNAIIKLDLNEVLDLTVINQDSLAHTFTIDGLLESNNAIPSQSSAQFSLSISQAGTYRFYSNKTYGGLIGASGILLVGYTSSICFYWNLFEMNRDLSNDLARLDETTIPNNWQPENFFINGAHFPNTLSDPDAYVEVQLGDTVIISIVNSGNMEHVLHFHGFHVRILHSSDQLDRVGWIKDTVPVGIGSTLTVELIADQEGIYPVHDHNLISVTNTGFYPGGMITQINVGP